MRYYHDVRIRLVKLYTPRTTMISPGKFLLKEMCFFRVTCCTVYPKKYAHSFCFAVLCCGYTLTDFPISIRLTSLALWQSYDCPSASKATLTNMDKYFMWIHYERLHNHNKAKQNKTVCIFFGICCTSGMWEMRGKGRHYLHIIDGVFGNAAYLHDRLSFKSRASILNLLLN